PRGPSSASTPACARDRVAGPLPTETRTTMTHRALAFLLTGLAGSLLACSPSGGGSGAGGASGSVASTGAGQSGAGGAPATSSSAGMQTSSNATSTSSNSASSGGGAGGNASTSSSSGGGPLTFSGFCDGGKTSLTGKALAPNAIDPLPNVRVYAAS